MTIREVALFLALALACGADAASPTLPIYIEDNHAGSFYWLAQHLDLDEGYTLIHFDAHSDASGVFDSDKLRERLRRVASIDERRELLERWREKGAIQCFNWIEPLMPAPISRVIWVRGQSLTKTNERNLHEKAAAYFDGHLEAAPRVSGSFRDRCRVVGLEKLRAEFKEDGPVVITIDLDYFAEVPAKERAAAFERVWKFVVERRNLRAITIAISRPYLKSDEQADDLLRLALEASLSLPTATIQFEPFAKVGNDRSLRAREFQKRNEEVPAFTLSRGSEKLRAVLLANRNRIAIRTANAAWEQQLDAWEKETPALRLTVRDQEASTDGVWRLPVAEEAEVELEVDGAIQRVQWFALVPEFVRCNLTAKRADEIGFASGAPPRPRWREVRLPGSERTLWLGVVHPPSHRSGAAGRTTATEGPGAMRMKARVEIDGRVRETAAIEIRRFAGDGFRAALTEQFRLPYLFGSGELNDGVNTGPETGQGADCANFIVYALRREGRAVPWSNPKQLRKYLEPVTENARAGETAIRSADIASGLIVHLGSHVAAVMEDRPPVGVLDRGDIVAHQLEGPPELLSLGRLLAGRDTQRFDLLRVPVEFGAADLLVGGDVMLGRTVGAEIERGADPLAAIRSRLEPALNRVVNLECVLSDKGTAVAGKRYCFRAPPAALRVLTGARISGVSLANNHANDFGRDGYLDAVARLRANQISVIDANQPAIFETGTGGKAAVVALDDTSDAPGLDRERAAAAIAEARRLASFVLVFMHWGEENSERVSERQRELARWLIDRGADAIAGSHPHCLQPFDSYHGRPIFYSLGNLVFDGAATLPSWNRGELLEIDLDSVRPAFRLVPVQLDARGFPQIAEPEQSKERRFTNRRPKKNGDL